MPSSGPLLLLLAFAALAKTPVKIEGYNHGLVLFSDGSVGGWGDMRDGQLGPRAGLPNNRGHTTALIPIALPGKAIDIAASDRSSYVLLEDGTAVAFGWGEGGRLGCGQPCVAGSETPRRVAGLTDVAHIAAGGATAFAIHRDGSVSGWGARDSLLFDGGQGPALTPVRLPAKLPPIAQIRVGSGFAVALTTSGRVWSWGRLPFGRIYADDRDEPPAEVASLSEVAAVEATRVAAALKRDGTVWVWGNNQQAQFGNGRRDEDDRSRTPLRVPGITGAVSLTGAHIGRHFLVLLKDGTLRGWGNSDWGQIGNGRTGMEQATAGTPRIAGVKSVFAVDNNSFAVKNDGTFWAWGLGSPYAGTWPPLGRQSAFPVALQLPD